MEYYMAKFGNLNRQVVDLSALEAVQEKMESHLHKLSQLKSEIEVSFLEEYFQSLKKANPKLDYLSWTQKYSKDEGLEIVNIQVSGNVYTNISELSRETNVHTKEALEELFDNKELLQFILGSDVKVEFQ